MNLTGIVQRLQEEKNRTQAEVDQLDAALAALRNLNGTKGVGKSTYAPPKRRQLSAAARRRISLAQKKRWRSQRQGLHVLSTPTRKPQTRVHWTQLPKNRARVLQLARKMTRARIAA
jgi:hypothetical protein